MLTVVMLTPCSLAILQAIGSIVTVLAGIQILAIVLRPKVVRQHCTLLCLFSSTACRLEVHLSSEYFTLAPVHHKALLYGACSEVHNTRHARWSGSCGICSSTRVSGLCWSVDC